MICQKTESNKSTQKRQSHRLHVGSDLQAAIQVCSLTFFFQNRISRALNEESILEKSASVIKHLKMSPFNSAD